MPFETLRHFPVIDFRELARKYPLNPYLPTLALFREGHPLELGQDIADIAIDVVSIYHVFLPFEHHVGDEDPFQDLEQHDREKLHTTFSTVFNERDKITNEVVQNLPEVVQLWQDFRALIDTPLEVLKPPVANNPNLRIAKDPHSKAWDEMKRTVPAITMQDLYSDTVLKEKYDRLVGGYLANDTFEQQTTSESISIADLYDYVAGLMGRGYLIAEDAIWELHEALQAVPGYDSANYPLDARIYPRFQHIMRFYLRKGANIPNNLRENLLVTAAKINTFSAFEYMIGRIVDGFVERSKMIEEHKIPLDEWMEYANDKFDAQLWRDMIEDPNKRYKLLSQATIPADAPIEEWTDHTVGEYIRWMTIFEPEQIPRALKVSRRFLNSHGFISEDEKGLIQGELLFKPSLQNEDKPLPSYDEYIEMDNSQDEGSDIRLEAEGKAAFLPLIYLFSPTVADLGVHIPYGMPSTTTRDRILVKTAEESPISIQRYYINGRIYIPIQSYTEGLLQRIQVYDAENGNPLQMGKEYRIVYAKKHNFYAIEILPEAFSQVGEIEYTADFTLDRPDPDVKKIHLQNFEVQTLIRELHMLVAAGYTAFLNCIDEIVKKDVHSLAELEQIIVSGLRYGFKNNSPSQFHYMLPGFSRLIAPDDDGKVPATCVHASMLAKYLINRSSSRLNAYSVPLLTFEKKAQKFRRVAGHRDVRVPGYKGSFDITPFILQSDLDELDKRTYVPPEKKPSVSAKSLYEALEQQLITYFKRYKVVPQEAGTLMEIMHAVMNGNSASVQQTTLEKLKRVYQNCQQLDPKGIRRDQHMAVFQSVGPTFWFSKEILEVLDRISTVK